MSSCFRSPRTRSFTSSGGLRKADPGIEGTTEKTKAVQQVQPEPTVPEQTAAEPRDEAKTNWLDAKVEMPPRAREEWMRRLKERKKDVEDYLKIWRGQCPAAPDLLSKVEDVEDRECHLIERFKFVPRDEEWAIELTYKEFGDALPSEVQKSVEHLLEEYVLMLKKEQKPKPREFDLLNCKRPDLRCAYLDGAHLEGAYLGGAHLECADLRGAHLEGAFLRDAHLEGADLRGAHLEGANLYSAHLEGANLYSAHLEGASLGDAHLEGAELCFAGLAGALMRGADLTNVELNGATLADESAQVDLEDSLWTKGQPPKIDKSSGVWCKELPQVRSLNKTNNIKVAKSMAAVLTKWIQGGNDEDDGDDGDEDDDNDEDEHGVKQAGDDKAEAAVVGEEETGGHRSNECCVPLLCCEANDVQNLGKDFGEIAINAVADKVDEQLNIAAETAQKNLEQLMKQVDAAAKPQVQKLQKIMEKMEKRVTDEDKDKVVKAMKVFSTVPTVKKSLDDFNNKVDKFKGLLKDVKGAKVSQLLMKLTNSQLQAATGYSSGELLAFLKHSPKTMAKDVRELEDLSRYIEKVQETVNVNNWDDVVDNFMCMYNLQDHITGERSCSLLATIWKDQQLRKCVAVADLFQNVKDVSDPPNFIIHEVKSAVQHVKTNATAWNTALKKEIAAIDLIKSRQQAFFQFVISCISGFFVFLATLFSGLVLDAMKAGKVDMPFLSALLNSTDSS